MQGRNGEVFCPAVCFRNVQYASAASKRTNRRKARAREIHVKMYVSRLTMYMILKAAGTTDQEYWRAVAFSSGRLLLAGNVATSRTDSLLAILASRCLNV